MSQNRYPTPLVIAPSENHTHTIIALHGRGSNAARFGCELLRSASLQERLPTVKFIFPTASKRRSTILKRTPINQWFDNWSLKSPGERSELQVEGLAQTAQFLRALVDEEARILGGGEAGYRKIIIWGLSQGCAAGIFTVLGGWSENEGRSLGAFVGMSGWLPFHGELSEILDFENEQDEQDEWHTAEPISDYSTGAERIGSDEPNTSDALGFDNEHQAQDSSSEEGSDSDPNIEDEDEAEVHSEPGILCQGTDFPHEEEFDPFGVDEDVSPTVQTINHVRDILDLPLIPSSNDGHSSSLYHLNIPVFIGHGELDPKVSVHLGEKMLHFLSVGLLMDVKFKVYQGLGHWYRVEDEIQDILSFLQDRVNIPLKRGLHLEDQGQKTPSL